jgi:2-hydroxy-3-oxopropionate reductase
MEKIGFIGLGIMGNPMAGHLLAAGYSVVTTDHFVAAPKELLEKGLKTVKGNKAVAEAADIIITMVPDTPHVADVLFNGDNSLSAGLSKGKLVIDMSSISPVETKEFAKKVNATGADYLDAPVSGGEVGAKAASLSIMCGGSDASFERAKPVMEKMGKNITLVGPNGARPDRQGRQPDHGGADHRGGFRSVAVRFQGWRGSGKGAAGADGRPRHPHASSKCMVSA